MKKKKILIITASIIISLFLIALFLGLSDSTETININTEEDIVSGEETTLEVTDSTGAVLESAEIYSNEELIGETDSQGQITFETPPEENIEIRGTYNGIEQTITIETVSSEDYNIEIKQDDVQPGETIQIALFLGEDRISGEQITVNNDEIGETDILGRIEFEVPDEDTLSIIAPNINTEKEVEFTEEKGEFDYSIDLEDIEENEIRILTVLDDENSALENVEVYLDDEQMEETNSSGQTELNFSEAGQKNLELRKDSFETVQETVNILEASDQEEVEEDDEAEDLEINLLNTPREGEETQIEFLSNSERVNADITIDNINHGSNETFSLEPTDDFTIEAEYNGITETKNVEIIRSLEIEKISPDSSLIYEEDQEVEYEFEITGVENDTATYILELDETELPGELEEGTNTILYEEPAAQSINLTITEENEEINLETTLTIPNGEDEEDNGDEEDEEETEEPEFELNNPTEGEIIETFEDSETPDFSYTVHERGWAEEATIKIEETEEEYTRSISSGQTYGDNFQPELEASETGEQYTWTVTLTDGEQEETEEKEFTIEKTEPEFEISIIEPVGDSDSPETLEDHEEVDLKAEVTSEDSAELKGEIIADEDGQNCWEEDEGDDGSGQEACEEYEENEIVEELQMSLSSDLDSAELTFERDFDVAMRYRWSIWIEHDDERLEPTNEEYFQIEEEP